MNGYLQWFKPVPAMFIADQNIGNGLEWSGEFDIAMVQQALDVDRPIYLSLGEYFWDASRAYCAP